MEANNQADFKYEDKKGDQLQWKSFHNQKRLCLAALQQMQAIANDVRAQQIAVSKDKNIILNNVSQPIQVQSRSNTLMYVQDGIHVGTEQSQCYTQQSQPVVHNQYYPHNKPVGQNYGYTSKIAGYSAGMHDGQSPSNYTLTVDSIYHQTVTQPQHISNPQLYQQNPLRYNATLLKQIKEQQSGQQLQYNVMPQQHQAPRPLVIVQPTYTKHAEVELQQSSYQRQTQVQQQHLFQGVPLVQQTSPYDRQQEQPLSATPEQCTINLNNVSLDNLQHKPAYSATNVDNHCAVGTLHAQPNTICCKPCDTKLKQTGFTADHLNQQSGLYNHQNLTQSQVALPAMAYQQQSVNYCVLNSQQPCKVPNSTGGLSLQTIQGAGFNRNKNAHIENPEPNISKEGTSEKVQTATKCGEYQKRYRARVKYKLEETEKQIQMLQKEVAELSCERVNLKCLQEQIRQLESYHKDIDNKLKASQYPMNTTSSDQYNKSRDRDEQCTDNTINQPQGKIRRIDGSSSCARLVSQAVNVPECELNVRQTRLCSSDKFSEFNAAMIKQFMLDQFEQWKAHKEQCDEVNQRGGDQSASLTFGCALQSRGGELANGGDAGQHQTADCDSRDLDDGDDFCQGIDSIANQITNKMILEINDKEIAREDVIADRTPLIRSGVQDWSSTYVADKGENNTATCRVQEQRQDMQEQRQDMQDQRCEQQAECSSMSIMGGFNSDRVSVVNDQTLTHMWTILMEEQGHQCGSMLVCDNARVQDITDGFHYSISAANLLLDRMQLRVDYQYMSWDDILAKCTDQIMAELRQSLGLCFMMCVAQAEILGLDVWMLLSSSIESVVGHYSLDRQAWHSSVHRMRLSKWQASKLIPSYKQYTDTMVDVYRKRAELTPQIISQLVNNRGSGTQYVQHPSVAQQVSKCCGLAAKQDTSHLQAQLVLLEENLMQEQDAYRLLYYSFLRFVHPLQSLWLMVNIYPQHCDLVYAFHTIQELYGGDVGTDH